MKIVRAIAVATALLAALVVPTAAHADGGTVVQPFYADSTSPLDTCPHGITSGTLAWSLIERLPITSIDVAGTLIDRPQRTEPTFCRDDGYSSSATFTAYSGKTIVDSHVVGVDNDTVKFEFALGSNSAASGLTHIVIQVCRDPVRTLPPSYCGRAVTYPPNVIGPA